MPAATGMPGEAAAGMPGATGMPGKTAVACETAVAMRKAVTKPTMLSVAMIPVVMMPVSEPAIDGVSVVSVSVIPVPGGPVHNGLRARGQAKTDSYQQRDRQQSDTLHCHLPSRPIVDIDVVPQSLLRRPSAIEGVRREVKIPHESAAVPTKVGWTLLTPAASVMVMGDHALATVSVVDDDESLRRSLRNLLESVGFRVETFASADAFLRSTRREETRCLVLDLRMPGMNGLELLRHLSNRGVLIPTIILTAHSEDQTRQQSLHAGAVAFMGKPFDGNALLDAVRAALHQTAH